MKLSLQWIFDHINADWRKQDPEYIAQTFNQKVAEIEGLSRLDDGDVIFEVDNKSLTHRPDMWGHRGFAREIAAFLDLELKPLGGFLKKIPVHNASQEPSKSALPFAIKNTASSACPLFNGMYVKNITVTASPSWVVERLSRVGVRSINIVVDMTNYVMFDLGQPTHCYDAKKIEGQTLVIRMASPHEELKLLDGTTVKLTADNLVIADAHKALGLAGIMGGLHDSISATTSSFYLESAAFNASVIRKSSAQHHIRTEASARFEKALDPHLSIPAIQRFFFLLDQCGAAYQAEGGIMSIGSLPTPKTVTVTHSFLESRIGQQMPSHEVEKMLTRLEFGVASVKNATDTLYTVTIPSFRATKDIAFKEDIVEEVARCYGFGKIALQIPFIKKRFHDLTPILRLRKIKQYLAFSSHMMEQQTYVFSDSSFMAKAGLTESQALEVANPVAQTHKKLLTSLVPHLFKKIQDNFHEKDSHHYFEWARIWPYKEGEYKEQKSLAGVFFEKKGNRDFYEVKAQLEGLFKLLSLPVVWEKSVELAQEWVSVYQAASIKHDSKVIGYLAKASAHFLTKLGFAADAESFVFEVDGDFLISYVPPVSKFETLARFQGTTFDLSFLLPLAVTTVQAEESLKKVDPFVEQVRLVDFFEKEEWDNVRSLAFRVWVRCPEKTLTREEIEEIRQRAIVTLQSLGGELRVLS